MKVKDAYVNNLPPAIAVALAPFIQPLEVDEKALKAYEFMLANAVSRRDACPPDHPNRAGWDDAVIRLQRDVQELKAGVPMKQLSSRNPAYMPDWGTYGT